MRKNEFWLAVAVDFGSAHILRGPYSSIEEVKAEIKTSQPSTYRILETRVVLKTQVQMVEEED